MESKKDLEELYNKICRVLTWYEQTDEYPFKNDVEDVEKAIAEDMYDVLVDIQNKMANSLALRK